ncbi:MAG: hypothetical protein MUP13_09720 [Thermoanaerobaculales bacterium]|nr:hypothetical protein [Thermoanaerobaculales bacterium]
MMIPTGSVVKPRPIPIARLNPPFHTRFPRGATLNIVGPQRSAEVKAPESNNVQNGTSAARGLSVGCSATSSICVYLRDLRFLRMGGWNPASTILAWVGGLPFSLFSPSPFPPAEDGENGAEALEELLEDLDGVDLFGLHD